MEKELNTKVKEVHQELRWEIIQSLTKLFPNDIELGKHVREFVKLNQKEK